MTDALIAVVAVMLVVHEWRATDWRDVRVYVSKRRARVTKRLRLW